MGLGVSGSASLDQPPTLASGQASLRPELQRRISHESPRDMKYRVPRQIEVGTENSGPGLRVAIPTTVGPGEQAGERGSRVRSRANAWAPSV